MQKLVQQLTAAVITYGIIKEDDRELYEYSFRIMLEQVSIGISILLFSLFLGVFFETIIYMVLFIPLRIYAGGYHARDFFWCYIISVGVYVAFALVQRLLPVPNWLVVCAVTVSAAVIFLLAPMADSNKPINIQETTKFKKRVRIILLSQIIIFFMCLYTGITSLIGFISFVFIHLALLLIAGKVSFESMQNTSEHF